MRSIKMIVPLLAFLLFIGCVSSSKYQASLDDIDNLKKNVSGLEDQLSSCEQEKNKLNENLEACQNRIHNLDAQVQDISLERELAVQEKEKAIAELKNTYNDLVSELKQEIQGGQIAISQLKDRLSLSMVEKILFDSGSAKIKKEGKKVLNRVGEILAKVKDKQINIEGHTDNVPISSSLRKVFPTNWELSTARASNVVRYLQENTAVDPNVLSAVGFAEFRPVAPNDTPENKAKNRRIEIVLVPLIKSAPTAEGMPAEEIPEEATQPEEPVE